MKQGFFKPTEIQTPETAISKIPKCGVCKLYKHCKSPKMKPTGEGKRKILIVAEAPGATEDEKGVQLIGQSGKYLEDTLRKCGIEMRKDCWLTNAIICRPAENRTPDDKEIDYCRPNLFNTIEELKPEIIIPLGGTAVKSLIGGLWKDKVDAISRWVGWRIPVQKINTWVCPTYHPAFLLRGKDPVTEMYFTQHLKDAVSLPSRPWRNGPPDWKSRIKVLFDPLQAAGSIRELSKHNPMIAFDYETNCLKPDNSTAKIISCSVHFDIGKGITIAFPWRDPVIDEVSHLLMNPKIKKIGSNIKFEERWTRAVLGHGVKGWHWDTMLAAHVLDNRTGITGLKFQAFVQLGQDSYDDHIKPFLYSGGSYKLNKINQLDMQEVLVYNGLDSLLEFKVYHKQARLLGV